MNQWPMVKLGDVCDIKIGKTPARKNKAYWGVGTPWLSIKDMNQGAVLSTTSEQITDLAVRELNITPYPAGTVFFSFKLSIGKVGISTIELFTNEAIAAILPKDSTSLDKNFLMAALRVSGNLTSGNDAVLGQTLNKKSLQQISIPLPPLEDQRRIARILGHSTLQNSIVNKTINKLNTARQGCIEKYVADPSKTPRLESLANLQGGLSLSKTRGVNPVEVEYLRVANIQRNNLILDNLKTIRCTEKELERCTIKDGDILMLEANANPLEVGRAAVAKVGSRHLVFQNHLFRVRPTEVSPIVLNALLSSVSVRTQLLRLAKTTSGLNTMTISQARSLRIPLRDELTTREFERQLTRIEQQKKFLAEKQSLLEELHQSLATRAFAGQL
ncbi:restriction endonuclease subunit S [uncultured Corynebacterium sp.]|uniref:restriction endonuclease subunit S n=1 Tax=uncultured Corynebacterium sp. TaxID=159447 RepID=UPI00260C219E|nr:restriction endonuclease subunit S [uncultured Corynebacterium sp.]